MAKITKSSFKLRKPNKQLELTQTKTSVYVTRNITLDFIEI